MNLDLRHDAEKPRLETGVSRGIVAGVLALCAITSLVRRSTPPPSLPPPVVTDDSPLASEETASDASGTAVTEANRAMTFEPGRLDLTTISESTDGNEPFPVIEGEVVSVEDGEPIPNAELVATIFPLGKRTDHGPARVAGRADPSGRFSIRAAEHFDLAVRAPGRGWECACVERKVAEERRPLRFSLSPALILDVRVFDADGTPAAGVNVHAEGIEKTRASVFHGPCGNPLVEWQYDLGSSDAAGRLDPVESVRGRTVAFVVSRKDECWILPSITLDDPPGSTRRVELRLAPLARVEGRVLHPDGSPAQNARLTFERRFDAWGFLESETGPCEDGSFSATLGAPGRYCVRLETASDEFGWVERDRRELDLTAGENRIDFVDPDPEPLPRNSSRDDDVASPRATVSGRVAPADPPDASSENLPSGEAWLVHDGRIVDHGRFGTDGTFEFESVEPGRYSLVLLLDGFTRFDGEPFDVEAGSSIVIPVAHVHPAATIRGRALTREGRPVVGASIGCQAMLDSSRRSGADHRATVGSSVTDSSGAFELRDVGGARQLVVEDDGVVPLVVPLPEVGSRDSLEVVVPPPRVVRGRVVVPGGLPDVKLEIRCFTELSFDLRRELGEGYDRFLEAATVEVERDGAFVLPSCPPAAIDLRVWLVMDGFGMGNFVASRLVPAGSADVGLGDWALAADSR